MVYIPSFAEVLQVSRSCGRISKDPGAWDGLVGTWTDLQGGGKQWKDVSGHDNHAALSGAGWVTTSRGYGMAFAAADTDSVVMPSGVAILQPDELTFSAWVKQTSVVGTWGTVCAYDSAIVRILNNTAGDIRFDVGSYSVQSTGANWTNGVWQRYVLTVSGSATKFYLDGKQVFSGAGTTIAWYAPGHWELGTRNGGLPFNGLIESASIHARALAASEIQKQADPTKRYDMFTRRPVQVRGAAVVGQPSTRPFGLPYASSFATAF